MMSRIFPADTQTIPANTSGYRNQRLRAVQCSLGDAANLLI
ncbi:hypothetical protein [Escherichia coli]|nr:hypothetical protein [Escherichia coli]